MNLDSCKIDEVPENEVAAEIRFWKARSLLVRTMMEHKLKKFVVAPPNPEKPPRRFLKSDSASQIVDRLYLGSYKVEQDLSLLQSLNITYVLQVGRELSPSYPNGYGLKYLTLSMFDLEDQDLVEGGLHKGVAFIHEAIQSGASVLVHCQAGISRSSSLVIAYLMAHHGHDYTSALKLVRKERPYAEPNRGFALQLEIWGKMGCDASAWPGWGIDQLVAARRKAFDSGSSPGGSHRAFSNFVLPYDVSVHSAVDLSPPSLSQDGEDGPSPRSGQVPTVGFSPASEHGPSTCGQRPSAHLGEAAVKRQTGSSLDLTRGVTNSSSTPATIASTSAGRHSGEATTSSAISNSNLSASSSSNSQQRDGSQEGARPTDSGNRLVTGAQAPTSSGPIPGSTIGIKQGIGAQDGLKPSESGYSMVARAQAPERSRSEEARRLGDVGDNVDRAVIHPGPFVHRNSGTCFATPPTTVVQALHPQSIMAKLFPQELRSLSLAESAHLISSPTPSFTNTPLSTPAKDYTPTGPNPSFLNPKASNDPASELGADYGPSKTSSSNWAGGHGVKIPAMGLGVDFGPPKTSSSNWARNYGQQYKSPSSPLLSEAALPSSLPSSPMRFHKDAPRAEHTPGTATVRPSPLSPAHKAVQDNVLEPPTLQMTPSRHLHELRTSFHAADASPPKRSFQHTETWHPSRTFQISSEPYDESSKSAPLPSLDPAARGASTAEPFVDDKATPVSPREPSHLQLSGNSAEIVAIQAAIRSGDLDLDALGRENDPTTGYQAFHGPPDYTTASAPGRESSAGVRPGWMSAPTSVTPCHNESGHRVSGQEQALSYAQVPSYVNPAVLHSQSRIVTSAHEFTSASTAQLPAKLPLQPYEAPTAQLPARLQSQPYDAPTAQLPAKLPLQPYDAPTAQLPARLQSQPYEAPIVSAYRDTSGISSSMARAKSSDLGWPQDKQPALVSHHVPLGPAIPPHVAPSSPQGRTQQFTLDSPFRSRRSVSYDGSFPTQSRYFEEHEPLSQTEYVTQPKFPLAHHAYPAIPPQPISSSIPQSGTSSAQFIKVRRSFSGTASHQHFNQHRHSAHSSAAMPLRPFIGCSRARDRVAGAVTEFIAAPSERRHVA